MASLSEINTTAATTPNDAIDPAPEDNFRPYDAGIGVALNGSEDSEDSDWLNNLMVRIWSPLESSNTNGTQTTNVSSMNSSPTDNQTVALADNVSNTFYTWTSASSGSDSYLDSNASTVFVITCSSPLATDTKPTNGNKIGNEGGCFYDDNEANTGVMPNTYTTSPKVLSDVDLRATEATGFAAGEAEDDINFALIDSAETALGGDTDYETIEGFNGGIVGDGVGSKIEVKVNGVDEDTAMVRHSIPFESYGSTRNDSYFPSFDGGGTGASPIENGINAVAGDKSGSTFMLLLEDFGDYFYNFNGTGSGVGDGVGISDTQATLSTLNVTDLIIRTNCSNITDLCVVSSEEVLPNYWALLLMVFPLVTLFGNILVILSVCRERSLQTVTNYFIVSLAIADLLVAVVVMPFAVYVLVNRGHWDLPPFLCDFYIAMDVICSTSSIFNLVAISIDRYIAVTRPIEYAKHRNSPRVCLTILLAWAISVAIGLPIVMGLNNTPDRDPGLCLFYNTMFILCSSLTSFYIPCIIMVFLYWSIFRALSIRAQKARAVQRRFGKSTRLCHILNDTATRQLREVRRPGSTSFL
ncbi:dopamine D2-like receptor, partial [Rhagoletis pomonella]|uniref:dopamine D2-like receptor n=1 Tax=Rhagoletis pomonella TaxID=28610 RepID=UPI0017846D03